MGRRPMGSSIVFAAKGPIGNHEILMTGNAHLYLAAEDRSRANTSNGA